MASRAAISYGPCGRKLKLEITYVSGEEIDKIVADVLSIPQKVKDNLQFLSQAK